MRPGRLLLALVAMSLLFVRAARAEATSDRFGAAGYLRIGARPDFQGGYSQLGYWNLYGRLLNEGPYGALEMKLDLLQAEPGSDRPWTTLHARIEGGSVNGADPGNGALSMFRMSQLYVQAGNLLLKDLVWQIGTLYTYWGDLGLYDMRPADLFGDTVGASARYHTRTVDLLVGLGDAGYAIRGANYNTILSTGAALKIHPSDHFEIGIGGQFRYEPQVIGNKNAPYATPNIDYADYLRGEVVKNYLEANPHNADYFPPPDPRSSQSFKLVGYLGFGGLGPLLWNSFYFNFQHLHPDQTATEDYNGKTYTLYIHDITDERYQFNAGNEARFELIPQRLDLAWGVVYGNYWDNDNKIAPSDNNRIFYSTVVRAQAYLTSRVHFLVEGSAAYEKSMNGNMYRDHADSIFQNTAGQPDPRGLEYGADNVRTTQQLKIGPVLSPLGSGIYTRPSLRLLYGLQHSSQNNAWSDSFPKSLDENNYFQPSERHWHHVISLEAEAWF